MLNIEMYRIENGLSYILTDEFDMTKELYHWYSATVKTTIREHVSDVFKLLYKSKALYQDNWGVAKTSNHSELIEKEEYISTKYLSGTSYQKRINRLSEFQLSEGVAIQQRAYQLTNYRLEEHSVLELLIKDYLYTDSDIDPLWKEYKIIISGNKIDLSIFFGNFFGVDDASVYVRRTDTMSFRFYDHEGVNHDYDIRSVKNMYVEPSHDLDIFLNKVFANPGIEPDTRFLNYDFLEKFYLVLKKEDQLRKKEVEFKIQENIERQLKSLEQFQRKQDVKCNENLYNDLDSNYVEKTPWWVVNYKKADFTLVKRGYTYIYQDTHQRKLIRI